MAEIERQDTFNKVSALIAKELSVAPNTVKPLSTLQDLGADSLAMVEIIMKMEEQFGIQIDDERAEQLTNVQEVVDYVHSLRNK